MCKLVIYICKFLIYLNIRKLCRAEIVYFICCLISINRKSHINFICHVNSLWTDCYPCISVIWCITCKCISYSYKLKPCSVKCCTCFIMQVSYKWNSCFLCCCRCIYCLGNLCNLSVGLLTAGKICWPCCLIAYLNHRHTECGCLRASVKSFPEHYTCKYMIVNKCWRIHFGNDFAVSVCFNICILEIICCIVRIFASWYASLTWT